MAGRGGIRSTSFKKGQNPICKKGTKHRKTKVKEAMGLTGWEKLCNYILNEGADKYVEEMQKLKGKDFHTAYNALTEFVKPKLTRQEVKHEGGISLSEATIEFS